MGERHIAGVVHDWQLRFSLNGIDFNVNEKLTDDYAVCFDFFESSSKYAGTHFVSRLVIRDFKGDWQSAVWLQVVNRIKDAQEQDHAKPA